VTIPDILAAAADEKPEPAASWFLAMASRHGEIFEDTEKYYALLMRRVGKGGEEGKTLDDIKKEVRCPNTPAGPSQDRFPTNIDAATRW